MNYFKNSSYNRYVFTLQYALEKWFWVGFKYFKYICSHMMNLENQGWMKMGFRIRVIFY